MVVEDLEMKRVWSSKIHSSISGLTPLLKFPAKSAFWDIENKIGNNKELILKLLKFKSFEVASIHVLLRDDRDIALKSFTYFPERFKHFSKKLQEDFEIIKETFKRDFPSSLYNYLPEYIKNDPKLASELIRFSPNFYFSIIQF